MIQIRLTQKQETCVYWLSEGHSYLEIADEMNLTSVVNVMALLKAARDKLDAKDNDELITQCLIRGILKKRKEINNVNQ